MNRTSLLLCTGLLLAATAPAPAQPVYYLSNFAGAPATGSIDGTGPAARFNFPAGTAVDSASNIYVADELNHTIRKVTPAGVVTTLAGLAGVPGSANGSGPQARFFHPRSVAVDGAGNVYVADAGNFTLRVVSPTGLVTTLAGQPGQPGEADGTGPAARFRFDVQNYGQTAIALDSAGNLYVADGNIRKVTPAGVVTTFARKGQSVSWPYSSSMTLDHSLYVGVDGSGNVFTNQYISGSIGAVRITPDGTAYGANQGGPGGVGGLAVSPAGAIYLYNGSRQTLYRNGTLLAGTTTAYYGLPTLSSDGPGGTLGFPRGFSVDAADNVTFSDNNTGSIRRVSPTGVLSTVAGRANEGAGIDGSGSTAWFPRTAGIAVDAAGNAYVADVTASVVRKITPAGVITTLAGSAGSTGSADGTGSAARFNGPQGVALDAVGNLYVADTANHAIRKVTPAGVVTTLAGTAGQEGSADGDGANARFKQPTGLAVDSAGNVFVCDSLNRTMRKITTGGTVTTLAGAAGAAARLDGAATAARFTGPRSMAIDGTGNLYVVDTLGSYPLPSHALRKITPAGVVTTLDLGSPGPSFPTFPVLATNSAGYLFVAVNSGLLRVSPTGEVVALQALNGPLAPAVPGPGIVQTTPWCGGLAVDSQDVLYIADGSFAVRKATPLAGADAALSITQQPASATVEAGQNLTLSVTATGSAPISYRWAKDGTELASATGATLDLRGVVTDSAGVYHAIAINADGAVIASAPATVTVRSAPAVVDQYRTVNYPGGTPDGASSLPANTVYAGAKVLLAFRTLGAPAPAFAWRRSDGASVGGSTGSTGSSPVYTNQHVHTGTLLFDPITTAHSGEYTATATNAAGQVTSLSFPLTVVPRITAQPGSLFVPAGETATFTVTVTGSSLFAYQWRKDGQAIPGATQATLTITNVRATDAAQYSVQVSDPTVAGSSTLSNAAQLTITNSSVAPTITTQPTDLVAYSSYIPWNNLQVQASGSPSNFTYQWRRAGVALPGANSATLEFPHGVTLAEVGTYSVVVTNSAGSVTSQSVNVSLFNRAGIVDLAEYLNITQAPANQVAEPGGTVTFAVAATSPVSLTYQWQKNGVNLAGETGSALSLRNVSASDAGLYTVIVSASSPEGLRTATGVAREAAVPRSATLTFNSDGTRTLSNQTVATGHNVTFTAAHSGGTIRWQVSTDNGATWTDLADDSTYGGTGTARLTVNRTATSLNGNLYRYSTTNGGTAATSSAAKLTVAPVIFPYPVAVATDEAGNLFVADAQANTISKVSPLREVSVLAGAAGTAGAVDGSSASARFNQPGGIVVMGTGGNVIVTDTGNATIRSIIPGGNVVTLAGSAGVRGNLDAMSTRASFSSPLGLAKDRNGALFIADAMNATIRRLADNGPVTTVAGQAATTGSADGLGASARFNLPSGVAVDADGNVFVSDTNNHTIRKISPAGAVTTVAGLPGVVGSSDGPALDALLNRPTGLALDAAGNLFIADTGNSTIRRLRKTNGSLTTVAGLPGIAGLEDSSAGSFALFNQPQGLAVDAAGNLYVADTGNAAIRHIDVSGAVTTLQLTQAAPNPNPASGGGTSTPSNPITTSPSTPVPPSSGGGGGGAPSVWFLIALGALRLLHRCRRLRSGRA